MPGRGRRFAAGPARLRERRAPCRAVAIVVSGVDPGALQRLEADAVRARVQRREVFTFGGLCSNSYDLDIYSFRVFDMKTGVQVVFRRSSPFVQLARDDFPIEPLDADRKVIHQASGALVMERNQNLSRPETHNLVRLVLTHNRQAEHPLIKGNGTRQITDLDAHVVNLSPLDAGLLRKSSGCRAARRG